MPWKEHTVLDRRMEFVGLAASAGISMSELCRRFAVSRKTGYKWLGRAEAATPHTGPSVALRLADRSRRPARSPSHTSDSLEAAVLELRHAYGWGGRTIAHVLARDRGLHIASSTVTNVLHRHGLVSPASSVAATRWHRFEHDHPNSLWQMDFKGHFAMDTGRCHPLTVLDDHSRFNLVLAACANEKRADVQQQLHDAFTIYGLPERINTDNGKPWGNGGQPGLTGLAVWLVRLGIKLSYSRPAHPQTNGKEERFHRTLKAAVLQQRFGDLPHVQRAFDSWREVYNRVRPHHSLGMDTPSQRYRPSPRSLPGALPDIEYDCDDMVRKVQQGGWISLRGQDLRVSKALVGQPVALRPHLDQDGIYDLYFCHHRLDEIDLRKCSNT